MTDRFMARQAVFVIVRNDKDELLLQQRAGKYLSGYWDFPSGHVERGEDLRVTAVRELEEETGIVASPESLVLRHIDQYFLEVDYINFVFELRNWQGKPKICEPEKCSGMDWFAQRELPEKCVNVVRVVEAAGFTDELTYSVTNRESYERLMGERFHVDSAGLKAR